MRGAYPDLIPDKEYPPLKFRSLKGKVSAAEWHARVDCAGAYRLVRHFGMDDLIYNHISARVPGTEEFLLNPFGLMYDEMCASSLIKVNLAAGRTVAEGFNNLYRIERACRAQLMAQNGGGEIVLPPPGVVAKTNHLYKPGTRRAYGLLEWPAMRRLADRIEPSYRN